MDRSFMFTHIAHPENFIIFDTKWIPSTVKFVAVGGKPNGTGVIKVLELNGNAVDVVREINKKSTFKCAAFGLSQVNRSYLSIGDFCGALQIINVERLDGGVYSVPNAHRGIINCIDTAGSESNRGAAEIVTGGQDGFVKIWDPRQYLSPVATIKPLLRHEGGTGARDCWSVAFADSYNNVERTVCAGYDNGDVKLFDLRTMRVRWETNVRNGVCGLEANNKYERLEKLVATTLAGGLNVFDLATAEEKTKNISCISKTDADEQLLPCDLSNGATEKRERPTVWCVRHLPQNRHVFATCGGSGNLRLWLSNCQSSSDSTFTSTPTDVTNDSNTTTSLRLMHEYSVSNKPVNCFDWSPDRMGLAVCGSFDKIVRVIVSSNLPQYSII